MQGGDVTVAAARRSAGDRGWFDNAVWLAAATGVTLLAAALRVYRIDWQSVWVDEIYSLIVTDPSRPLEEFWERVLADVHPPLYYVLLRVWSAAFGQTELAVRALSALFGLLTVIAAYVVFRPVLPPLGRLGLMLLIAVSPAAIQYSQEARSYALLIFLSMVMTGLCAGYLRAMSPREATARIAGVTFVGALASFTHYFGFLLATAAFAICWTASFRDPRQVIRTAIAGVLLAALFLPWVIYHSRFMSSGFPMAAWIGQMSISVSVDWFVQLTFGGWLALGGFATALSIGLLVSRDFRRSFGQSSNVHVALALAGLTFAAAVAISCRTPILTSRNMVVVLPAIYLLVADVAVCSRFRRAQLGGAVLLLGQAVLIAQTLPGYYTYMTKEQWRASAAFVIGQSDCNTASVPVYGEAFNYRYFTDQARPAMRLLEIPRGGRADLSVEPRSDCPILLWAADLWRVDLDALLPTLSLDSSSIDIVEFYRAFVVMRK
jgi:mannosyltransferase